ncbi:MAG: carbon-nitrogen family hydrolase [Bacillota bacterium]
MKINIVQIDLAFGDPEANQKKVKEMLLKAVQDKPDVIVLPEMWNTSFSMENLHEIADVEGAATKSLIGDIARTYHVNIVAGSVAVKEDAHVYNRMYVVDRNGKVCGHYDKVHLIRHAREHEFLKGGNETVIFNIDDICCGAIICYDIRFPELARSIALKGAKVLFIPAQWPETRIEHWRTLAAARAIENQMYVVAVNRIGYEYKANFPGQSLIIDPWGKIVAETNDRECIMGAEIDIDLVDRIRKKVPCFLDRNEAAYKF